MLYDSGSDRIILPSGRSIVDMEDLLDRILLGGDYDHLLLDSESSDSRKYELVTGRRIVYDEVDQTFNKPDHSDVDTSNILERIESSYRFKGSDDEISRIEEELDFFIRANKIVMINKLIDLIDNFKQSGIIWGVGRGSSCSSLIMYLLEVNDINPLEFDIPFSELSKE